MSLLFLVPPGENGLNVAKIQNHKTITSLNETSRSLVHNYVLLLFIAGYTRAVLPYAPTQIGYTKIYYTKIYYYFYA